MVLSLKDTSENNVFMDVCLTDILIYCHMYIIFICSVLTRLLFAV